MNNRERIRISKFLSLVLRHRPAAAHVELDDHGWVSIDELLAGAEKAGRAVSRDQLLEVVRESAKQRFAVSPDGTRIRANQGHSVSVELGLDPVEPPDALYHGTFADVVDAIMASGLRKMKRHHVHLSADVETAVQVGARRGTPVLLAIAARDMFEDGFVFYRTSNGVWLVDAVPARYLTIIDRAHDDSTAPQ